MNGGALHLYEGERMRHGRGRKEGVSSSSTVTHLWNLKTEEFERLEHCSSWIGKSSAEFQNSGVIHAGLKFGSVLCDRRRDGGGGGGAIPSLK